MDEGSEGFREGGNLVKDGIFCKYTNSKNLSSLFFTPQKSIPMDSVLLPKGSHKSFGWSNGFGTDVSNMALMVIDTSAIISVYVHLCLSRLL